MPVSTAPAGERTQIAVAAVGFFGEYFFDTFLGGTFGSEDDLSCCSTAAKLGTRGLFVTFVVHKFQ